MSEHIFADLVRTMGQFNCGLIHSSADGGSFVFIFAPTPLLQAKGIAFGKDVEDVVTRGIENAKLAQATYARDLTFEVVEVE